MGKIKEMALNMDQIYNAHESDFYWKLLLPFIEIKKKQRKANKQSVILQQFKLSCGSGPIYSSSNKHNVWAEKRALIFWTNLE